MEAVLPKLRAGKNKEIVKFADEIKKSLIRVEDIDSCAIHLECKALSAPGEDCNYINYSDPMIRLQKVLKSFLTVNRLARIRNTLNF